MRNRTERILFIVAFSIIIIGMVVYHFIENLSWLDAAYFSVVTLASVGYGDIYPKTEFGKLFTIFYILAGIGIIAAFINMVVKRAARRGKEHLMNREKSQKTKNRG